MPFFVVAFTTCMARSARCTIPRRRRDVETWHVVMLLLGQAGSVLLGVLYVGRRIGQFETKVDVLWHNYLNRERLGKVGAHQR